MVAVRRVGHLPSCPVFDAAGESYRRYPVYRRDGATCVCAANHTGGRGIFAGCADGRGGAAERSCGDGGIYKSDCCGGWDVWGLYCCRDCEV